MIHISRLFNLQTPNSLSSLNPLHLSLRRSMPNVWQPDGWILLLFSDSWCILLQISFLPPHPCSWKVPLACNRQDYDTWIIVSQKNPQCSAVFACGYLPMRVVGYFLNTHRHRWFHWFQESRNPKTPRGSDTVRNHPAISNTLLPCEGCEDLTSLLSPKS